MNYFKLLSEKSKEYSSKNFIIVDGKSYTYEKIYKDAQIIANEISLLKSDYLKGYREKPIFISSNDLYMQLTLFFAVNSLKCIPIIIHNGSSNEIVRELMIKNNIPIIISDEDFNIDKIKTINLNFNSKIFNIIIDENISVRGSDIFKMACMGVLSSGSTGLPKVLYRSYESWTGFFEVQNNIFKINNNSRVFISGSFSFTGNLNVIISVLFEGATVIVESRIAPKRWIKIIEESSITNIYLVPTKLKVLSNVLYKEIGNVRSIFTGSQLLYEDVADKLKEYFNKAEIILYYGTSELNYVTYIEYEDIKEKPLSIGKPFPGVDIFIEDEFIYVNTKYHIENIDMPYTVFDKGYIDEDGYLIFEGRKDDVVNSSGVKISLLKIERALKKIHYVEDIVVISDKDTIRDNNIYAFIVTKKKITKGYIIKNLKENLMNIEIPRKFIFIDKIPINTVGKIDKQKLSYILKS